MRTRLASIHAASLACACAAVLASCSDRTEPSTEPARSAQALGGVAFEPNLGAPGCINPYLVSSGCSSGILLAGPDAAGPEFHAPNTLGTACMERGDVSLSVQAIEVASPDGAPMAAGQPLDVQVTVAGSWGGYVQLWYAPNALAPVWQPIHDQPLDLGGGSEATVATTIVLEPGAVQAIRATIGPPGEVGCAGQTDTDDLAFAVIAPPPPDPFPFVASPRNGAVVTGDVVLSIGDPGFPVVGVAYFTDDVFLAESVEPPSFRAVWPTTPRTEPATATLHAYAYGAQGEFRVSTVAVTVATSAACDLAGGPAGCIASTHACGSDRGLQGARGVEACGWEPWITCAGRLDDGTMPFVDHLVVRSRDGSPLAPGVDARVDVDLGGPIDGATPGLALDVYLLDPWASTWTLLETMPVTDASRRSVGFRLPVPTWRFDASSFQYVRAVLRDGGAPFTCDASILDDDVLAFAAPDTVPPTVGLVLPQDGAVWPTPAWLLASARDTGGIDHVTFLADDAPVAEAWGPPYQVLVDLPPGPHRLAAEAWDRNGNRAVTADAAVTFDAVPPVVALTAPAPGATVHGIVDVSIDASDDTRVVEVQLELDGALIGAAAVPPWTFPWDTTGTTRGPHWLRAIAIDAVGNRTLSAQLPVVVDQLPFVQLMSPLDGEELYAPAVLSAVATDDAAVARVEFLVDGVPVATRYAPPYELVWTPPALGTYRVAARACDASAGYPLLAAGGAGDGQCATTPEVQIRFVQLVPADTDAPVVALTAPQRGASVTGVLLLEASAWDAVGVTVVSFYANAALVGRVSAAPWAVDWDSRPYQGQPVTLVATAADAAGNVTTSAAVNVLVPDVTAPWIELTSPAAGATLFKSTELHVAAVDNVAVVRVDYYADGALIGTTTQAPFELVWNVRKVDRGPHTLQAHAIDAAGNAALSEGVRVLVK